MEKDIYFSIKGSENVILNMKSELTNKKDSEIKIGKVINLINETLIYISINKKKFSNFIEDLLIEQKEKIVIFEYCDKFLNPKYIYYWANSKITKVNYYEYDLKICNSKEQKIKLIKENFKYFLCLSDKEKKDFDYQMASLETEYNKESKIKKNYDHLYTDKFLDCEETVKAIFKFGTRRSLFKNRVKDIYKNNEKLMLECLKYQPDYLCYLPFKYRNNKQLVLELISKNNNLSLRYLSKRLRNDKQVVSNFIIKEPLELKYASNRLKNDYDVCMLALKTSDSGSILMYIKCKEILTSKFLVNVVLGYKSMNIGYKYIGDNLKNDKNSLIAILYDQYKYSKFCFEINPWQKRLNYYQSLNKMSFKDLTIKELEKSVSFDLECVGSDLLNDKDFIIKYINKKPPSYINLSDDLKNDAEFVLELREKGFSFELGKELLKNKKFVKNNISKFDYKIEDFSDEIKNDFDIAKIFVKKDGKHILSLNETMQKNKELIKIALDNWKFESIADKESLDKFVNLKIKNKEITQEDTIFIYDNYDNKFDYILDDEFKEEYKLLKESDEDSVKLYDKEVYDPLDFDDSYVIPTEGFIYTNA